MRDKADKIVLSPNFRAWLRDVMTEMGYSVNSLALAADVHQSLFNAGLLGSRNISNDTLEKIAPHLGLSPERLTTLADLDRMGGIERIQKHAPEVLERLVSAPIKRKATSDLLAQVRAQLPEGMAHPPTEKELKLLERIGGFDGSELDPRSQSPLWHYPPAERWPELRQAEKDWEEDQDSEEGAAS